MDSKQKKIKMDIFIPKTKAEIKETSDLFLDNSNSQLRNIWELSLLLGLRVNELLQIKFSDLIQDGEILKVNTVKERRNDIVEKRISKPASRIILNAQKKHPNDIYLFQSKNRNRINCDPRPITRQVIYKAFSDVGKIINKKLTPHSVRGCKNKGVNTHCI